MNTYKNLITSDLEPKQNKGGGVTQMKIGNKIQNIKDYAVGKATREKVKKHQKEYYL